MLEQDPFDLCQRDRQMRALGTRLLLMPLGTSSRQGVSYFENSTVAQLRDTEVVHAERYTLMCVKGLLVLCT